MKVLTAAQMREADRLTTERYGIPSLELMENAGTAISEFLREKFADIASRKILVLCGKGNNGGDGLVVARHLKDFGSSAVVLLFANPGSVEGDAAANLKRWQQGLGEMYVVTSEAEWESARPALVEAEVIVDALLGTGLRGQRAATAALLAASPSVTGITGEYWSDCQVAKGNPLLNDGELARRLWQASKQIVQRITNATRTDAGGPVIRGGVHRTSIY